MRNHLVFLISVLLLMILITPFMAAAAPADEQTTTITIVGGKVNLDEPATVTVADGIVISGYIIENDGCYVMRKRTEIEFQPAANKVTVRRLEAAKSILGANCIFGGDSEYTETSEDVSVLKLGPGEKATITWNLPEPKPAQITEPEQQWTNPKLAGSDPDTTIFVVRGVGDFRKTHGHRMPALENSSPITITPVAEWLGGFDLHATRWSGIEGKELELYSIPVATWQKGKIKFDAAPTGPGEYSLVWMDTDGIMLTDPGPFPEFQITGADVGNEVVLFLAFWDQSQKQWRWQCLRNTFQ